MSEAQLLRYFGERQYNDPRTLEEVDRLAGRDFEFFAAKLLHSQGYDIVQVTRASRDLGTDIVAERDGSRYSVQVKRWKYWVSPDAVREGLRGKAAYGCHEAMVVANRTFMPYTKTMALHSGCILVDRKVLGSWLQSYIQQKSHKAALLARAPREIAPAETRNFRVGERVKHPHYGKGQVIEVRPRADDQLVVVAFEDIVDLKKWLASAGKLEHL